MEDSACLARFSSGVKEGREIETETEMMGEGEDGNGRILRRG